MKAFLAGTSSNLSGVVEIDKFAVFLLSEISFRNNVGINWTLRQYPALGSCRHKGSLNDLECPIQLKVRFTDGTRRLAYVCCGFRIRPYASRCSQRGMGSGLEGLAASMWAADALFLCGS